MWTTARKRFRERISVKTEDLVSGSVYAEYKYKKIFGVVFVRFGGYKGAILSGDPLASPKNSIFFDKLMARIVKSPIIYHSIAVIGVKEKE